MISHLIERVESASGPDEELDCAIHVAVFGWKLTHVGPDIRGEAECDIYTPDGNLVVGFGYPVRGVIDKFYHLRASHPDNKRNYTASLDAVLALIEAKMPGYDYAVGVIDGIPFGDVGPQSSFEMVSVKHKTPALSLLASFLRAWKEQNNER